RAAQNAGQVFASREAVVIGRRGLELLKMLPDTPERAQEELQLQTLLGTHLQITKGYAFPEVREAYSRARELCERTKVAPELFQALWGISVFHLVRAEYRTARELAAQLLTVAEGAPDLVQFLPAAHDTMALTLYWF